MWSVGSKLVRPVDGVTVEENSEQMGDVDEVLGQMLFHVVHDGEISKVAGPGGISALFLCKVAAADPPLQPHVKTVPPVSVQLPLTLLESQLQLLEPEEPTSLPLPLNNKELYTNMYKTCGTLKDYIL